MAVKINTNFIHKKYKSTVLEEIIETGILQ